MSRSASLVLWLERHRSGRDRPDVHQRPRDQLHDPVPERLGRGIPSAGQPVRARPDDLRDGRHPARGPHRLGLRSLSGPRGVWLRPHPRCAFPFRHGAGPLAARHHPAVRDRRLARHRPFRRSAEPGGGVALVRQAARDRDGIHRLRAGAGRRRAAADCRPSDQGDRLAPDLDRFRHRSSASACCRSPSGCCAIALRRARIMAISTAPRIATEVGVCRSGKSSGVFLADWDRLLLPPRRQPHRRGQSQPAGPEHGVHARSNRR